MAAVLVAALMLALAPRPALAQGTSAPANDAALRAGKGYIATPVFTLADDQRLLALFEGLRVADVADGMYAVGLQGIGLMDPSNR